MKPGNPRSAKPHDRLFRHVFSDPEHAQGALRTALPAALATCIDWPTLHVVPGSFVDPELEERHTDILFSVAVDGRPLLLYLLLEHQSSSEPLMVLRLLGYMVRIWDDHVRKHADAGQLPPIVPIVVHHSERGWTAPRSLGELFDLDGELRALLGTHIVDFEIVLDDISHVSDGELRTRTLSALARLALVCLSRARRSPDITAELTRWADAMREVVDARNGVTALGTVLRYILQVTDTPPEHLRTLTRTLGPRGEEAYMTGEQILIQRGEVKGRAEAILRVLAARQVALSPEQRQRVLACTDLGLLERWLDRAVTAIDADALFPDE